MSERGKAGATPSRRIAAMRLFAALVAALSCLGARAGELTKADLERLYPAPFVVGELHPSLPARPIHRRDGAALRLHAHVFETIDIEPVRGYGGKPTNLLVAIGPDGVLRDVRLLSHAEPIFMSESGTRELATFARQYEGLTPQHTVQVLGYKATRTQDATTATLHGVLRGTVSALAIDRSVLEAAAQVASAGLEQQADAPVAGAATGPTGDAARASAAAATPLAARTARGGADDRFERMGWNELVDAGLVQPLKYTNRDVARLFRDTAAARLDSEGAIRPDATAIDAWIAPVGLPHAGRNLLDPQGWRQVRALREDGRLVLLLLDGGRYRFVDGRGPQPARAVQVAIEQDGRRFALERFDGAGSLRLSGRRSGVAGDAKTSYFRTLPGAAPDPLRPMTIAMTVLRQTPADGVEPVAGRLDAAFALGQPERWRPQREPPPWLRHWAQRGTDLAVLGLGLVVLTIGLVAQRRLAHPAARLRVLRIGFLVYTLGFIGWHAQGQLTIVNATSLITALRDGDDASFLMTDPMAVVLWAFVAVTLFVWGRGTFCGWLCPFGALQELSGIVARALGFKPYRMHPRTDARLKTIKYAVLALMLGAAAAGSPLTGALVEVEPFKTAISQNFVRHWPYVAWAVLCVLAGVLLHRGFCRYLCPLGAGLALLGRVRLLRWIPRRAECGQPCQSCRHRCEYQAIAPDGAIAYAECFQCLDCVSIHEDPRRCLPLIRADRPRPGRTRPGQSADGRQPIAIAIATGRSR